MKITDPPVVVEQTFNAPKEKIWQAITDPVLMRQWFFDNIPDFKAEVGFTTRFDVHSGERTFPHLWRVSEVIANQKLSVNWKFGGYDGDSFVHFELFAEKGQTTLRVTTEVVEDFDDAIPEFRRESSVAGWKYFIQDRLKEWIRRAG